MTIWFWIVIALIAFAFITLVRKWYDYEMLFTIAIGFAVNANIYNSSTVPIMLGDLVFAIDSILYTGFMFVVVICAREYGIKKAKILTSTTIAAILISAGIEFCADVSSFGYSVEYLHKTLAYIYSAIGTFVGIWVMLYIYHRLENATIHVSHNLVLCVLVASIINTFIYYGLSALTIGLDYAMILNILWGSSIGKFFCIALGLISYYINTHYWIPNELAYKYKMNKDEQVEEKEEDNN